MGAGSRPIVVIGEVGVGKTSFFENLYYSINEHDRSDTIFISIDLGKNANLSSTVKDFILTEVPRIL